MGGGIRGRQYTKGRFWGGQLYAQTHDIIRLLSSKRYIEELSKYASLL